MNPEHDVNDASMADPALGRLKQTATYDNEPLLVRHDESLILVYRRATLQEFDSWGLNGHVSNDGRIVARRSIDGGRSWTAPVTVADTAYDTRNQSIVVDRESGRISIFYRVIDAVEYVDGGGTGQKGLFRVESRDGGRSWSDPDELDWSGDRNGYIPFGGYARIGDHLLTCCYGEGEIELSRSMDGGRTWSDPELVLDSSNHPERTFGEPTPCAIGGEKLLLYGRENTNADFWVSVSEDIGKTWTDPTIFDPGSMEMGTPLAVRRTDRGALTAVWADRTAGALYTTRTSVRHGWQNPTWLAESHRVTLARMEADSVGDFGYPTIAKDGAGRLLVAYYDGTPRPDIFIQPITRIQW